MAARSPRFFNSIVYVKIRVSHGSQGLLFRMPVLACSGSTATPRLSLLALSGDASVRATFAVVVIVVFCTCVLLIGFLFRLSVDALCFRGGGPMALAPGA